MRAPKLSAKVLLVVVVLAGLWLVVSRTGRFFPVSSAPASKENKLTKRAHLDPAPLPAGTVWTFRDGASTHTYAIALDELYVPAGPGAQRIHRLSVQADLPALLTAARSLAAQTGTQPQLVLYPLTGPRDESSRRIVTMKVHIETKNLAAVQSTAALLGLTAWETPSYAPGHAIAVVPGDPSESLRVAALLAKFPDVSSASPLLASQRSKKTLPTPTDTLFPQQWHLKNTGQQNGVAGIDINVTPVWPTLDGAGVNIGIVDDGLQISHPDLAPNVSATGNFDWNDGDTNPSPDVIQDYHGTACAGLAAARDNGAGVVGAAPEATLYGLRLIALPETDQDDASAMAWKNDVIQIKSNSWGPADDTPWILGEAGSLWLSAVADSTTTGRGGLGTIYVWASGNGKEHGDQGGKDAYSSNLHVIAVGALTNKGSSATFSEGGAHLVVCAPGDSSIGIITTDLVGKNGYNPGSITGELGDADYTETFAGTSAAAPIAAGVIALILEANPNLGWRDVKEILLRASTQIQPTDTGWVTRDGGQPDLPLIKHHAFFGGGLINAKAATDLAKTWTLLGTEAAITRGYAGPTVTIPDAGAAIIVPFDLGADDNLRVEHVELTVSIVHAYRGDIEIKLTSPSGTVSTLASPTAKDYGANYDNWTFSSVRHWGEASKGIWTLSIRDAARGDTGRFVSATVKVHGVAMTPPAVTLQPQGAIAAQSSAVTLTTAGSDANLNFQWSRNGSPVFGATGATLSLPAVTLAQAGTYTCTLSDFAGNVTTDDAKVVVYNPVAQTQYANAGTPFTTPLVAAGPVDSFQWFFNGSPLANSGRISGADTATLAIAAITPSDNGAYTVQAMFAGGTLPTGAITFNARTAPVVTAPSSFESRLGAAVALQLSTDRGAYAYHYSGLPNGVACNPTTGALTGRALAAGTFPVVLTATDAFGLITTANINLVIAPLPAALVGVFNGTVARDATLNQNLGGTFTFTTTTAGQLTGKLTQGATANAFTGVLDGAVGAPATASITVARKGLPSLPLTLSIPLDDTGATGVLSHAVPVVAWRKAAAATAYAGRYTFALETPAGPGWPAGYSTGTLAITTAGTVTWTLQPADGTAALTGSTVVSTGGVAPLFAPVKTPAGSFLGSFALPINTKPSSSMGGALSWLRAATASALYANAAGFGPLALTVHGGLYTAPASGSLLLGLPVAARNANLEFAGADINLGEQGPGLATFGFTLTSQNKVITPTVNPTALKLSINTAAGTFTGTFTLTDSSPLKAGTTLKRSEKFSGVFLLQDDLGAGFFILPGINGSGNGTRSGSVIIAPAP